MPAVQKRWTIEEFERLIKRRPGYTPRYELADGELLMTPSPSDRHQRIVAHLFLLLAPYISRNNLGEARLGPGAVRLTPGSYFEPDLYVVPAVEGRRPRVDVAVAKLVLAVEVVSPSSALHDRITKRRFFQKCGVPWYWVVDGDAGTFEVWRPGDERPAVVNERLLWTPDGARETISVDVKQFFADVADD